MLLKTITIVFEGA